MVSTALNNIPHTDEPCAACAAIAMKIKGLTEGVGSAQPGSSPGGPTNYTESERWCRLQQAVVDGKEPTQTVNLPPSGQAGSSPANGTNEQEFIATIQQETNKAVKALNQALLREQRSPEYNAERDRTAKAAEDARFDERVACAAIVLQQSATSGQPQRDWAQQVAKAILTRGKP